MGDVRDTRVIKMQAGDSTSGENRTRHPPRTPSAGRAVKYRGNPGDCLTQRDFVSPHVNGVDHGGRSTAVEHVSEISL